MLGNISVCDSNVTELIKNKQTYSLIKNAMIQNDTEIRQRGAWIIGNLLAEKGIALKLFESVDLFDALLKMA